MRSLGALGGWHSLFRHHGLIRVFGKDEFTQDTGGLGKVSLAERAV